MKDALFQTLLYVQQFVPTFEDDRDKRTLDPDKYDDAPPSVSFERDDFDQGKVFHDTLEAFKKQRQKTNKGPKPDDMYQDIKRGVFQLAAGIEAFTSAFYGNRHLRLDQDTTFFVPSAWRGVAPPDENSDGETRLGTIHRCVSSSPITVTVPNASDIGDHEVIFDNDGSADVTIQTSSTTLVTLSPDTSSTLYTDQGSWRVL